MRQFLALFIFIIPTVVWAWCDHCGGDGSCCRCPSGQAQCLAGHSSCEAACGLLKSSPSSSASQNLQKTVVTSLIQGMFSGNQVDPAQKAEQERVAAEQAELKKQKDLEQAEIFRRQMEELKAEQNRIAEESKNKLLGKNKSSNELSLMGLESTVELQPLNEKTGEIINQKMIAKKQTQMLNCALMELQKKSKGFEKDFDSFLRNLREDLSLPCNGQHKTHTIQTLTLSKMQTPKDKDEQLVGDILVDRNDESCEVHMHFQYSTSKMKSTTQEGQSLMHIDKNGKILSSETSKAVEKCLSKIQ